MAEFVVSKSDNDNDNCNDHDKCKAMTMTMTTMTTAISLSNHVEQQNKIEQLRLRRLPECQRHAKAGNCNWQQVFRSTFQLQHYHSVINYAVNGCC